MYKYDERVENLLISGLGVAKGHMRDFVLCRETQHIEL